MTLPASQYSVLDAKQIERIDDSTFRCYVGGLRFLGFTIDPVLTVSVDVTDRGPTVRLLSTKVQMLPWKRSRIIHRTTSLSRHMLLLACARPDERMLCSLRARLLSRLQMTSFQRQWSTKSAGAH